MEEFEETDLDMGIPTDNELPPCPNEETPPANSKEHTLVCWLSVFLLRLQARHYIPDIVLTYLLKFLYVFLSVIGRFSDVVSTIAKQLPQSVYSLQRLLGYQDCFEKLVVCPKCNQVYKLKDCNISKLCVYEAFPRQRCNTVLLKTVELTGGKKILDPKKVYCYQSLQSGLQRLLLQPGFLSLCEQWRSREKEICWRIFMNEFLCVNGSAFLSDPFNFALALNVDWFQPYKHTKSAVGVVYLSIMNLPHLIRFKREYALLVGIWSK